MDLTIHFYFTRSQTRISKWHIHWQCYKMLKLYILSSECYDSAHITLQLFGCRPFKLPLKNIGSAACSKIYRQKLTETTSWFAFKYKQHLLYTPTYTWMNVCTFSLLLLNWQYLPVLKQLFFSVIGSSTGPTAAPTTSVSTTTTTTKKSTTRPTTTTLPTGDYVILRTLVFVDMFVLYVRDSQWVKDLW